MDHYAPNRHDTGSTTARSVDEVALIGDTISHYAPVLIAALSIGIRRAGVQKKFVRRRAGAFRRIALAYEAGRDGFWLARRHRGACHPFGERCRVTRAQAGEDGSSGCGD